MQLVNFQHSPKLFTSSLVPFCYLLLLPAGSCFFWLQFGCGARVHLPINKPAPQHRSFLFLFLIVTLFLSFCFDLLYTYTFLHQVQWFSNILMRITGLFFFFLCDSRLGIVICSLCITLSGVFGREPMASCMGFLHLVALLLLLTHCLPHFRCLLDNFALSFIFLHLQSLSSLILFALRTVIARALTGLRFIFCQFTAAS